MADILGTKSPWRTMARTVNGGHCWQVAIKVNNSSSRKRIDAQKGFVNTFLTGTGTKNDQALTLIKREHWEKVPDFPNHVV